MLVTDQDSTLTDPGALAALVDKYKYGRYCEDVNLPIERSRRFLASQMESYCATAGNQALASVAPTGELQGVLQFRISPWDTDHFGYTVAIIDALVTADLGYQKEYAIANALLDRFDDWCRENSVRFVSARVPSLHLPVVHSFEQKRFRYIETWIFNKYDLNRLTGQQSDFPVLRKAEKNDVALMLEYSKNAFATQRFHADPRIDPEKADSLYKKWILTAAADPHQEILTLDHDGKAVAFMIYYPNDLSAHFDVKFAQWKMALLDPNSRGKGVGTDFFMAVMHRHRAAGLGVVDSGLTARNLASLNLHNKLGFKIVCTIVTFHKWIGPARRG